MIGPATSGVVRRVVVALDASRQCRLALDAAAWLAEWHGAELRGLYVEDINLIRLASLRVGREIGATGSSSHPIDAQRLARRLSSSAAEAEHWLADAAARRNLRWTFRVERGDVTSVITRAAGEADIFALGRAGTGTSGPGRLGSTARALAIQQSGSVIVMQAPLAGGRTIVALFDGSAAGARALKTAAQLSERLDTHLVVLATVNASADSTHRSQLRAEAEALVTDVGDRVVVRSVTSTTSTSVTTAIARAVQAENPSLCVVACQPEATELGYRLADQLRVSVFLVK